MSQREQQIERRKLEALEVFEKFRGQVPLDLQKKVLAQQVDIGMDPYMARLAEGLAFSRSPLTKPNGHLGVTPNESWTHSRCIQMQARFG